MANPYDKAIPKQPIGAGLEITMTDDPTAGASCFIKVSAQSNVKAVAGKIAHSCRDGEPPAALCIGANSINQAVKAICIARGYLADDSIDLSFQPAFRDMDRTRASVALYMSKAVGVRDPLHAYDVELPVSGHTTPAVTAGALAARIRENKSVCLTAIGVDAVANAVLAVGNARLYLEENKMDVRIHPEFVIVKKDGRDLNAVRLGLSAETI